MKKLLYIVGSPRESASESSKIANAFLKQYKETNPNAVVDVLDLWKEKIPAFDGNKAAAKMTFLGFGELEGKLKTAWDEVIELPKSFGLDFQLSYMNWWLELIGVTTVHNVMLLNNVLRQSSLEQDRDLAMQEASAIAKEFFSA